MICKKTNRFEEALNYDNWYVIDEQANENMIVTKLIL